MPSIGTTRVEDVMISQLVTVKETDSMDVVAIVLKKNDINAAPVVNEFGKCVGIITSHDLVEFESVRKGMQNAMNHGTNYNVAHYGSGMDVRIPGMHFNEAGFHMTKTLQTASADDPLSRVASKMCAQHIHHVLVVDDAEQPIGMLSSLDILGFVIGEPVCRSANCTVE